MELKQAQNRCYELLNKSLNINNNQIKDIQLIQNGYTNYSFCISLINNQKYFIKISKQNLDCLTNETLIYENYLTDLLIYSEHNDIVLKWFDDDKKSNLKNILNLLFIEIDKFHQINIQNATTFDFFKYEQELKTNNEYYLVYKKILDKFKDTKKVFTHSDINLKNFLYSLKLNKVILIDFEWSCYNYAWFDYINVYCENDISDESLIEIVLNKLNITHHELNELFFVRWYFCYSWAKHETHLLDIKEYEERSLKKAKYYFDLIVNNF